MDLLKKYIYIFLINLNSNAKWVEIINILNVIKWINDSGLETVVVFAAEQYQMI